MNVQRNPIFSVGQILRPKPRNGKPMWNKIRIIHVFLPGDYGIDRIRYHVELDHESGSRDGCSINEEDLLEWGEVEK
jgi:hypothetical protein